MGREFCPPTFKVLPPLMHVTPVPGTPLHTAV